MSALSQSPFAKPLYRPYSTSTSVGRAAPAPAAPSQQGSTRAPPPAVVEKNFIARLPDGSELAVDVDQAAALAAKNFDVYPAGAGLGGLGGHRRDDGEDGSRAAPSALQSSASTSSTATASAGNQTATAFVKARGLFPDERHSLLKTFGSELHPAHGNGYGRRSGAALGDLHEAEHQHEDSTPASPLGRVAKRFLESRVAGMVLGDVNADPLGEAVFDKIGQKTHHLKQEMVSKTKTAVADALLSVRKNYLEDTTTSDEEEDEDPPTTSSSRVRKLLELTSRRHSRRGIAEQELLAFSGRWPASGSGVPVSSSATWTSSGTTLPPARTKTFAGYGGIMLPSSSSTSSRWEDYAGSAASSSRWATSTSGLNANATCFPASCLQPPPADSEESQEIVEGSCSQSSHRKDKEFLEGRLKGYEQRLTALVGRLIGGASSMPCTSGSKTAADEEVIEFDATRPPPLPTEQAEVPVPKNAAKTNANNHNDPPIEDASTSVLSPGTSTSPGVVEEGAAQESVDGTRKKKKKRVSGAGIAAGKKKTTAAAIAEEQEDEAGAGSGSPDAGAGTGVGSATAGATVATSTTGSQNIMTKKAAKRKKSTAVFDDLLRDEVASNTASHIIEAATPRVEATEVVRGTTSSHELGPPASEIAARMLKMREEFERSEAELQSLVARTRGGRMMSPSRITLGSTTLSDPGRRHHLSSPRGATAASVTQAGCVPLLPRSPDPKVAFSKARRCARGMLDYLVEGLSPKQAAPAGGAASLSQESQVHPPAAGTQGEENRLPSPNPATAGRVRIMSSGLGKSKLLSIPSDADANANAVSPVDEQFLEEKTAILKRLSFLEDRVRKSMAAVGDGAGGGWRKPPAVSVVASGGPRSSTGEDQRAAAGVDGVVVVGGGDFEQPVVGKEEAAAVRVTATSEESRGGSSAIAVTDDPPRPSSVEDGPPRPRPSSVVIEGPPDEGPGAGERASSVIIGGPPDEGPGERASSVVMEGPPQDDSASSTS